jgi:hypothetical protein
MRFVEKRAGPVVHHPPGCRHKGGNGFVHFRYLASTSTYLSSSYDFRAEICPECCAQRDKPGIFGG